MTQIALSPEDLKCLSQVLSAALDEAVEIDHLEDVSVGANKSRHLHLNRLSQKTPRAKA